MVFHIIGSGGISAEGFEIVMREQVIAPKDAAIRVNSPNEICLKNPFPFIHLYLYENRI